MRTIFATTLFLLAAYMAFLSMSGPMAAPRSQSQWQDNLTVMERFAMSSRTVDSAYVGSSLTRRLLVDGESRCEFNLALDGDSALTGLALIESRSHPIRQVFVEINVPQRPENPSLLAEASRHARYGIPLLLTENIPVNRLISIVNERRGLRPRVSPGMAAFEGALKLQQDAYDRPLDPAELGQQLDRFKKLVQELESRSTSVVFFELPVDASLEFTERARQIRAAFRATFPSNPVVGFDELAEPGRVSTIDGVHLTDAAAAYAASHLRSRFPTRCIGTRP